MATQQLAPQQQQSSQPQPDPVQRFLLRMLMSACTAAATERDAPLRIHTALTFSLRCERLELPLTLEGVLKELQAGWGSMEGAIGARGRVQLSWAFADDFDDSELDSDLDSDDDTDDEGSEDEGGSD